MSGIASASVPDRLAGSISVRVCQLSRRGKELLQAARLLRRVLLRENDIQPPPGPDQVGRGKWEDGSIRTTLLLPKRSAACIIDA